MRHEMKARASASRDRRRSIGAADDPRRPYARRNHTCAPTPTLAAKSARRRLFHLKRRTSFSVDIHKSQPHACIMWLATGPLSRIEHRGCLLFSIDIHKLSRSPAPWLSTRLCFLSSEYSEGEARMSES